MGTKYFLRVVTVARCSPHISLHARYPPHLRSMNATLLIYPIERSCCSFKRKRAAPWEGTKGRWTKKVFSASTHAFDPKTQTWEKLPDAPILFGYAAYTVIDNKLF